MIIEERQNGNANPVAPSDVGIHLGYIRRDIDEIKKVHEIAFREIQGTLKEIVEKSPSRIEFEELKKEVGLKANSIDKQQDVIDSLKGDRKWLMGAAAVLILLQGVLVLFAKLYIESIVNGALKIALSAYEVKISN